ncbi:MAG: 2-hydroxyglutaryl-CoA dehydratase D-component [Candidatus Magnetoglobus multicellularis str. Araruama]|uniref:2-hydroxyglutaryl-CoA dehydratase D-component n=1 Tax=Candidatus Magnetoglobus multicellularis str. Araruama TaxID=890399 RepID=A0A1V1PI58_9BACT|nr:MAG: 2-hydroxyglutaryl-CoA dehydratase D-component [Candidatus Magnetoglobus multicellularis str. Araruama]
MPQTNPFDFSRKSLLESAIEQDKIPIGYTCNYVPRMLLNVGPLFPYRVNAAEQAGGTEIADIYLSQVTCSYTRSILEAVMDDQQDFLHGWVFAASCDHLRRLYDNLQYLTEPDFCHILDVPHKCGSEAISWFKQELIAFSQALSDHFDIDIQTKDISQRISEHNTLMTALHNIAIQRTNTLPPFSGSEFHRLMQAVWSLPLQSMETILSRIEEQLPNRSCPIDFKARIMVISSVLDQYEWIEAIESNGALVVADRFCTGSIPNMTPCIQTDDPFYDMARYVLQTNACPRMMDTFEYRMNLIYQTIQSYHVDGVIIAPVKFCDIWGVETSQIWTFLKSKNIPVLRLEREYGFSGEGQLSTRVQAFLEQVCQ